MKYDYPLSDKLIKILKTEYRQEAIDKGNSWRDTESIDGLETSEWLLKIKLHEEFTEIEQLINRIDWDSYASRLQYKGLMKSELVDLILVACMAYERLDI